MDRSLHLIDINHTFPHSGSLTIASLESYLIMLTNTFSRYSHPGFYDSSGLMKVQSIPFNGYRMVYMLVIYFSF